MAYPVQNEPLVMEEKSVAGNGRGHLQAKVGKKENIPSIEGFKLQASSDDPKLRVLLDVTDYMEDKVTAVGILRTSGSIVRIGQIQAQLKSGKPLRTVVNSGADSVTASVHDIASIFKSTLAEVSPPLIKTKVMKALILAASLDREEEVSACLLALQQVSAEKFAILKHVLRFLARIAAHVKVNKMGPTNIAKCVLPNLIEVGRWDIYSKAMKNKGEKEPVLKELFALYKAVATLIAHAARIVSKPTPATPGTPTTDIGKPTAFRRMMRALTPGRGRSRGRSTSVNRGISESRKRGHNEVDADVATGRGRSPKRHKNQPRASGCRKICEIGNKVTSRLRSIPRLKKDAPGSTPTGPSQSRIADAIVPSSQAALMVPRQPCSTLMSRRLESRAALPFSLDDNGGSDKATDSDPSGKATCFDADTTIKSASSAKNTDPGAAMETKNTDPDAAMETNPRRLYRKTSGERRRLNRTRQELSAKHIEEAMASHQSPLSKPAEKLAALKRKSSGGSNTVGRRLSVAIGSPAKRPKCERRFGLDQDKDSNVSVDSPANYMKALGGDRTTFTAVRPRSIIIPTSMVIPTSPIRPTSPVRPATAVRPQTLVRLHSMVRPRSPVRRHSMVRPCSPLKPTSPFRPRSVVNIKAPKNEATFSVLPSRSSSLMASFRRSFSWKPRVTKKGPSSANSQESVCSKGSKKDLNLSTLQESECSTFSRKDRESSVLFKSTCSTDSKKDTSLGTSQESVFSRNYRKGPNAAIHQEPACLRRSKMFFLTKSMESVSSKGSKRRPVLAFPKEMSHLNETVSCGDLREAHHADRDGPVQHGKQKVVASRGDLAQVKLKVCISSSVTAGFNCSSSSPVSPLQSCLPGRESTESSTKRSSRRHGKTVELNSPDSYVQAEILQKDDLRVCDNQDNGKFQKISTPDVAEDVWVRIADKEPVRADQTNVSTPEVTGVENMHSSRTPGSPMVSPANRNHNEIEDPGYSHEADDQIQLGKDRGVSSCDALGKAKNYSSTLDKDIPGESSATIAETSRIFQAEETGYSSPLVRGRRVTPESGARHRSVYSGAVQSAIRRRRNNKRLGNAPAFSLPVVYGQIALDSIGAAVLTRSKAANNRLQLSLLNTSVPMKTKSQENSAEPILGVLSEEHFSSDSKDGKSIIGCPAVGRASGRVDVDILQSSNGERVQDGSTGGEPYQMMQQSEELDRPFLSSTSIPRKKRRARVDRAQTLRVQEHLRSGSTEVVRSIFSDSSFKRECGESDYDSSPSIARCKVLRNRSINIGCYEGRDSPTRGVVIADGKINLSGVGDRTNLSSSNARKQIRSHQADGHENTPPRELLQLRKKKITRRLTSKTLPFSKPNSCAGEVVSNIHGAVEKNGVDDNITGSKLHHEHGAEVRDQYATMFASIKASGAIDDKLRNRESMDLFSTSNPGTSI